MPSRETAFDRGRRLLQEGHVLVSSVSRYHAAGRVQGDSGVLHQLAV
jgi:hypothetical protein